MAKLIACILDHGEFVAVLAVLEARRVEERELLVN
jgi:hypothetical protein